MMVVIAENDDLHRAFIKSAVEKVIDDGSQVLETADGAAAIDAIRAHQPDSVVLDLQMPNGTGIDVAKIIWAGKPDTRILFWSNYADEAYVRGVARIVPEGAVYGYVLKSTSEERLQLAIRGVFIEDQCIIDREVRGVQQRSESRRQGLTDAEYETLLDVALGMTDKAIARRRGLSTRGVQSRLKHLYEKLCDEAKGDGSNENPPYFNPRTRSVCVAFARGLINQEAIRVEMDQLGDWLASENHVK